jgi:hypothetical protein
MWGKYCWVLVLGCRRFGWQRLNPVNCLEIKTVSCYQENLLVSMDALTSRTQKHLASWFQHHNHSPSRASLSIGRLVDGVVTTWSFGVVGIYSLTQPTIEADFW